MQQYADLLTRRLQQRQAMRAAEAVPLASGRARREEEASDSDFDDDEPAPSQRQPRAAKGAKRQRAAADQQVTLRVGAALETVWSTLLCRIAGEQASQWAWRAL